MSTVGSSRKAPLGEAQAAREQAVPLSFLTRNLLESFFRGGMDPELLQYSSPLLMRKFVA